ncbi:MAG: hypothetical protein AAFN77_09250 [Planctomycetota bacterium]
MQPKHVVIACLASIFLAFATTDASAQYIIRIELATSATGIEKNTVEQQSIDKMQQLVNDMAFVYESMGAEVIQVGTFTTTSEWFFGFSGSKSNDRWPLLWIARTHSFLIIDSPFPEF